MATVKVYSTKTCPWCVRAKQYLTQKKVKFEDLDVSMNERARDEMVAKTGQMGVPVLDINGEVIIGFDQEAIDSALSKK